MANGSASNKIEPFDCTGCGRELWDNEPQRVPGPGDHVICIYCAHVMQFDEQMRPRSIRLRDVRDPELRKHLGGMRLMAILGGPWLIQDELARRAAPKN